MRAVRQLVFWTHLIAGVVAGGIVLVMSVTGVVLTYQRQLLAWGDHRAAPVPARAAGTPRASVETLLDGARAGQARGTPRAITVSADPRRATRVAFGPEGAVFVDPYTGASLGEGATGMRSFFGVVTKWHRWLGRSGEGRSAGRALTGSCNLAFLVLVLTGAYLWIPRPWSLRRVRTVALFRRGLDGKARDFNWHNVVGLWTVLPLVVVVGSGVVISYPWASALVYRAVGERPPVRGRAPGPTDVPVPHDAPTASLDAMLARAAQQVPTWRTLQLTLPVAGARAITIVVDAGTGGEPQRRGTLTFDRATGAVSTWEPFASQSRGRRVRSFLRFAHTGEVGGLAGQTVAGLASLAGVVLVWTGIGLALRRFASWRSRRTRVRERHDVRAAA